MNNLSLEFFSLLARIPFYKKIKAELVSELQNISDPKTIPLLLPLVFRPNKKLAKLIADVLNKILIQIPSDEFIKIDEMIIHSYHDSHGIFHGTFLDDESLIKKVKNLDLDPSAYNAIFVLLSSHKNGYIREAAMQELSFQYPNLTIPTLLIRANDWVENIKKNATNQLIELSSIHNINLFLPHLILLRQLQQKQRYDHNELISFIENKLAKDCQDELLQIIACQNKEKSRIAFKILAINNLKLPGLIDLSSLSHDLVIKGNLLKLANKQLPQQELEYLLSRFLKDKSAIIRKKCIYIYLDRFVDNRQILKDVLKDALFDKAFSIRELARFYLRPIGADIQRIYKEALINKTRPKSIAIMGLAEAGEKEDFMVIEPYLHSSAFDIKSACIYAIFKLKPDNKQQLILNQLPSTSEKIIKTICSGLSKNYEEYDLAEIEKKFALKDNKNHEFIFMKLKLKTTVDRWDLIGLILDSLITSMDEHISDQQIIEYLRRKLSQWIVNNSPNKFFTRPSEKVLTLLLSKVDQLDAKMQDSTFKNLKDTLHQFDWKDRKKNL